MNIHVRLSRDLIFKNIFTTKKSKLLCLYPLLSTSNSFLITWLVIFISTDVKLQTEFCMEYIYNTCALSKHMGNMCMRPVMCPRSVIMVLEVCIVPRRCLEPIQTTWAIITDLGHITLPLWKHPFVNTIKLDNFVYDKYKSISITGHSNS